MFVSYLLQHLSSFTKPDCALFVRVQCLDALLTALVKEMGPERKNMEAVQVAERFVRSVVRVFTVCHTESVCVPSGSLVTTTSSSARRKRSVLIAFFFFTLKKQQI